MALGEALIERGQRDLVQELLRDARRVEGELPKSLSGLVQRANAPAPEIVGAPAPLPREALPCCLAPFVLVALAAAGLCVSSLGFALPQWRFERELRTIEAGLRAEDWPTRRETYKHQFSRALRLQGYLAGERSPLFDDPSGREAPSLRRLAIGALDPSELDAEGASEALGLLAAIGNDDRGRAQADDLVARSTLHPLASVRLQAATQVATRFPFDGRLRLSSGIRPSRRALTDLRAAYSQHPDLRAKLLVPVISRAFAVRAPKRWSKKRKTPRRRAQIEATTRFVEGGFLPAVKRSRVDPKERFAAIGVVLDAFRSGDEALRAASLRAGEAIGGAFRFVPADAGEAWDPRLQSYVDGLLQSGARGPGVLGMAVSMGRSDSARPYLAQVRGQYASYCAKVRRLAGRKKKRRRRSAPGGKTPQAAQILARIQSPEPSWLKPRAEPLSALSPETLAELLKAEADAGAIAVLEFAQRLRTQRVTRD